MSEFGKQATNFVLVFLAISILSVRTEKYIMSFTK